jgi:hypothetical protein
MRIASALITAMAALVILAGCNNQASEPQPSSGNNGNTPPANGTGSVKVDEGS